MNYRAKYALINGIISDVSKMKQENIYDQHVYEVIRIIDQIPLFLNDHLNRLKNSLETIEKDKYLDNKDLEFQIYDLIHLNRISEGNIRVDFKFKKTDKRIELAFIDHFYPDADMIEDGVKARAKSISRINPTVKYNNASLKKERVKANRDGFFEVLLVNDNGEITEGSQSNVFFVKGATLITCPDENVLLGISRGKVIKIAHDMGIPVLYKNIPKSTIGEFDGAFLTGTSINILPIRKIGRKTYDLPNKYMNMLINAFDRLVGLK